MALYVARLLVQRGPHTLHRLHTASSFKLGFRVREVGVGFQDSDIGVYVLECRGSKGHGLGLGSLRFRV